MKIYKVIADVKPEMCLDCKLVNSCNKGVYKTKVRTEENGLGTWEVSGAVPGDDCPIEVYNTGMDTEKEYGLLLKRFRHLLKSDIIALYDEVDPRTGEYKRDIKELDDIIYRITKTYPCRLLYTQKKER